MACCKSLANREFKLAAPRPAAAAAPGAPRQPERQNAPFCVAFMIIPHRAPAAPIGGDARQVKVLGRSLSVSHGCRPRGGLPADSGLSVDNELGVADSALAKWWPMSRSGRLYAPVPSLPPWALSDDLRWYGWPSRRLAGSRVEARAVGSGISGQHLACRPPGERCFQHAHAEGAGVSTAPNAHGQGDAGGRGRGPRVWAVISAVQPTGSARRDDGER
jgi:hypothetical protein